MKMKIEITMDNEAFQANSLMELDDCLSFVSLRFSQSNSAGGPILDSNGNAVGTWKVEE